MLKRLGYSADAVTNGREVLQALKHQPYDIVLMNLRMPEVDGFEATRMIRELCPAAVQPTIIALTAYILPNSKERCLEAGMNDFIAKPVKIGDLGCDVKQAYKNIGTESCILYDLVQKRLVYKDNSHHALDRFFHLAETMPNGLES